MNPIEARIMALKQEGTPAKEIAEVLKREGVKGPRGGSPNYFYVRNTIQRLKKESHFSVPSTAPVSDENTYRSADQVALVKAIFNAPLLSAEEKLAILKQYYFRLSS